MTPIAQEIISMIENTDITHWTDAHDKAVIAALRAQPDHSELATFLRENSDIDDAEFCRVMLKSADALEGKV